MQYASGSSRRVVYHKLWHGIPAQEFRVKQSGLPYGRDSSLIFLTIDLIKNSYGSLLPLSLCCFVVDNPWRCDCALHWLRRWIDEDGQRLLSSAERRLVCNEPPRLSHLSLVEVPLNSLVCIPPVVQLEPRRLAVHLGESLRVSCHASGYPRPQVSIPQQFCQHLNKFISRNVY